MGKPQDGTDPTSAASGSTPVPGESAPSHSLNPTARPFIPSHSIAGTPSAAPSTPLPHPPNATKTEGDDDIEMGEVAEEAEAGEVEDSEKWTKPKSKTRRPDEEMEEGEASDGSGELES